MRATRELLFAALVLLLSPFILVAAAIYCLALALAWWVMSAKVPS